MTSCALGQADTVSVLDIPKVRKGKVSYDKIKLTSYQSDKNTKCVRGKNATL